jgi:hypothetical protein
MPDSKRRHFGVRHQVNAIAVLRRRPEAHYYNWHYDVIEEFRDARVPMRGEPTSIQAFSVGRNIFGVQFRPEIDLKTIRLFVKIAAHRLGDFGAQLASDQIAAHQLHAQRNKSRLRAALFRWLPKSLSLRFLGPSWVNPTSRWNRTDSARPEPRESRHLGRQSSSGR